MGETVCREKSLGKRKLHAPREHAAPKDQVAPRGRGESAFMGPQVRGPVSFAGMVWGARRIRWPPSVGSSMGPSGSVRRWWVCSVW